MSTKENDELYERELEAINESLHNLHDELELVDTVDFWKEVMDYANYQLLELEVMPEEDFLKKDPYIEGEGVHTMVRKIIYNAGVDFFRMNGEGNGPMEFLRLMRQAVDDRMDYLVNLQSQRSRAEEDGEND